MAAPPEPGGLNAAPRWPLRRYSRFLPKATAGDSTSSWKVFNSSESAGQLELTIVQSGHFLITQGHGLLEGFSLLNASNFLKVIQKTDILLFRFKIKSESRMFRVQFEGSSKEEALEQCQSAVIALQQYLFVESTPVQGEASSADTHSAERKISEGEGSGATSEINQGSIPIRLLAQSFLGESKLTLPLVYRHPTLPTEQLGPFLRLCLLDQNFPAFVEQVERELKKLAR
ncbi:meiotic recombination protein REC114 isoform X1 [Lepisosteus oculatus]|uniref:meiotic recombination protein REC114 isoform X1 n=1 Tax=Lepisosteus oculatus TaxID=7918 RepID=UPI00372225C2